MTITIIYFDQQQQQRAQFKKKHRIAINVCYCAIRNETLNIYQVIYQASNRQPYQRKFLGDFIQQRKSNAM